MSSKENFAFTVRHSTLEDGDSKAPARALESSMASDPGQVSHLMLSEGEIERPKSADPSSGPPSSLSAKSHPSPSANDLLDRGSSTSTSFDSEDDSLSQSDQDFDSTPSMSPNLDMATPITRTRKAKATPRRDAPVVHLIGAEERSYKPVKSPRKVRFFVFTPQGRALSMSLSRHLHSVSDFLAYASIKLMEQERVVVPRNEPFSNAYFLPSFADLEDLSDIRENDQLVLVTSKLEPGEVLNSIGTTRMRSHSISTLPSPRSGPIASEWSNIVPVVEPSFHSSTKIFERFMTSESERFSKHNFQSALLDHRSRVRDSHIHDIVKRIESFASVGDRACWTTYSTAPAATTFDSFSGASPRAARRPSDFNPTTPRGGIAMQHSLIHHHQKTDVHMTPRSIESTASSLSVTYFSHGTHISPRSDYSGESPRGSRASSEYSSLQVPLSGMSAQQLRHAFEWERSENEIRAVVGAQTVADKWGERDKSKKERSRFLSADEEREAKKLEKRSSKNKADSNRIGGGFAGAGSGGGSGGGKGAFGGGNRSNFFSTGPQKGIIGALGTMPRSKPSGDGGLNSASTSRSSIVDASFDSPEDILMDPSGKVIGLKIEKLLQRLTSDSFPAVSLAKSFLLTYRLYMSPSELLNALEVRWDADGPPPPDPSAKLSNAQIQAQQLTPSRLRLITLVKQWAFKHASEDFEDGVVRNILFSFAAKMERSGVLNLTKEVESALFKKRVSVDNSYSGAFSSSAPNASSAPNSFKSRSNRFSINPSTVIGVSSSSQDPSLPSVADHRSTSQQSSNLQSSNHDLPSPHFPSHSFSASMSDVPPQDDDDSAEAFPTPYIPPFGGEMFDFHPLELARQITLIEKAYLDAIRPQEMLNLAWTKKEKEILAPNVLAMIRFSNYIVDWMCTEILKPTDALERSMVLNRFIYVGHYCMELNNFNGAVEVLSALRRSSIYRLRRSWNYLSDRAWNVFEQMELLFEPDANYKNYRAVLEKVRSPGIPYVGRILSDILFLEEKESNYVGNGEMINLVKLEAMATILKFVQEMRHSDYRLAHVEIITQYLYTREVYNEKQAYAISLEREKKVNEGMKKPLELSPSAICLEDVAARNDVFMVFRTYLEAKTDVQLLMFYKQVHDWSLIVRQEGGDSSKRARELANLIFEAFVADRSEQQIAFAKDSFILASLQEIEWKVKDENSSLPPSLFKPLTDTIIPVLQYHFDLFKRSLPHANYVLP